MKIKSTEEVEREVYNPNLTKIKPSHLELYKLMKARKDEGAQFTRDDLMLVYQNNVVPGKRAAERDRLDDDQIYANASKWLNTAIAMLVRRGYFGLIFKHDLGMEMEVSVECQT